LFCREFDTPGAKELNIVACIGLLSNVIFVTMLNIAKDET